MQSPRGASVHELGYWIPRRRGEEQRAPAVCPLFHLEWSSADRQTRPSLTSHNWIIDWDTLPGGNRWENATMGWASSADYMQGTSLKFNTKGLSFRTTLQSAGRAVTDAASSLVPRHRGRHPIRREAGLVVVPAGTSPRQVCPQVVSGLAVLLGESVAVPVADQMSCPCIDNADTRITSSTARESCATSGQSRSLPCSRL